MHHWTIRRIYRICLVFFVQFRVKRYVMFEVVVFVNHVLMSTWHMDYVIFVIQKNFRKVSCVNHYRRQQKIGNVRQNWQTQYYLMVFGNKNPLCTEYYTHAWLPPHSNILKTVEFFFAFYNNVWVLMFYVLWKTENLA